MLDPDSLYQVAPTVWETLRGTRPVFMHLLDGYVDAGSVAGEIGDHLLAQCEHDRMVTFDLDQLHDYRSRRPAVTFDTDAWVGIDEFELVMYRMEDAHGRPFVLFIGPEPDHQWGRTRAAVRNLCRDLDISMSISAFGMPTGTPHTRPSLITTISANKGHTSGNPVMFGRMDFPSSFGAAIDLDLQQRGVDAASLAVHVPHYLAQAAFPQAALAGLQRLVENTGLEIPLEGLEQRVRTNLADIDSEMAESTEVQGVVQQLEEQYDDQVSQQRGPLPSADEIGAELERFLAERNRKDEEGR